MYKLIEIIIIAFAGAGAAGFFIWYFIKEIRGRNACANCQLYNSCTKANKKTAKSTKI
jgi:hypothetical protein